MPPFPKRDYSIPQPAGFQLGTDGKRVAFPSIRRVAISVHGVVRRIFPSPTYRVQHGPQPQLRPQPNWPKDHTAVILPGPAPFREDT